MEEMMCGERRRTRSNMLKFEIRWTGAVQRNQTDTDREGLPRQSKTEDLVESWRVSKKKRFKKRIR